MTCKHGSTSGVLCKYCDAETVERHAGGATDATIEAAKREHWRQWAIEGMPTDKIRLAEETWKAAEQALRSAVAKPMSLREEIDRHEERCDFRSGGSCDCRLSTVAKPEEPLCECHALSKHPLNSNDLRAWKSLAYDLEARLEKACDAYESRVSATASIEYIKCPNCGQTVDVEHAKKWMAADSRQA